MGLVNDDKLYSIGDAARRTGLSVSAIRFYADADVIAPTSHSAAGHRFYDIDAIARLELVRTLRDLGAGLDDIRALLAEETSLHELASTHLELVERHLRDLRARRAVLRTIVNQPTTTEQVTLMHRLVSLSDDERNQLLDDFWNEVTEGLTVHPAFVDHLHRMRPYLPEDPTTEQLHAWIELADLVQDAAFRDAVRQFFHTSFASPKAVQLTSPSRLARVEKHRQLELEAWEAETAGLSPNSPEAWDIAERLLASVVDLTADATGRPLDEHEIAELRRSMITPDRSSAAHRHAEQAVSEFTGVLGRYLSLTATINAATRSGADGMEDMGDMGDAENTVASEEWLAEALRSSYREKS